jgi:2,4-dienoyl-CoA reductase-like NADH-dependent reductase (Old Yellow Enzyme family)
MPYTHLFKPVQFGKLTVPNRIQRTSQVTGLATEDGHVTSDIIERYVREAQGGVGSLVVEAAVVSPSRSSYNLRISDDTFTAELKGLADAICNANPETKVGLQIMHFLKISRSGWRQRVTDFTLEDMSNIIDQHVQGARRAVEAGFEFIELHMAHAYTLSSFLSLSNGRTDEYGGSLNNRMRLPIAVCRAVRQQVGDDYPLGVRINGEDFTVPGTTVLQSAQIAKRFAELGADYISVSAGRRFEDSPPPAPGNFPDPSNGYSGQRMSPAWWFPDMTNIHLAEAIRGELRTAGYEIPVITAGKIRNPELAEEALQAGKADVIGLCRALLCDPDWPMKAKNNQAKEIVTCTACNWCLDADTRKEKVYCSRWPEGDMVAPTPWLRSQARPSALSKDLLSGSNS